MADATTVVADPNMSIPGKEPAVETAEVKIGDKTFQVSKDAAAAIKAAQDAMAEAATAAAAKATALEAEVATLKKPATPAAPADEARKYDRMFADPKGFIDDLKAEIRTEIGDAYTVDQARRDFWTEFYRANNDLKEHDFYVKAVLERELSAMAKMQVPDAIKHLGTTVKADLLKLGSRPNTPTQKRPGAEGGNEHSGPQSKPESGSEHSLSTDAPKSLTALLKQRREARRTPSRSQTNT